MSKLDIESRIIRYGELIPCKTAFIDAHTPGSDKKENFCWKEKLCFTLTKGFDLSELEFHFIFAAQHILTELWSQM